MLSGKRLVITGVVNDDSIAFAVVQRAVDMGAKVLCTALPRDAQSARATLAHFSDLVDVVEADLTQPDDIAALARYVEREWGTIDGALHAVAFAPRRALEGAMGDASRDDVLRALDTSTVSFASLVDGLAPLVSPAGGSFVGLHFDAARAWKLYNWMGVCKAALVSLTQYLARDHGPRGIRVNLVAAGPIRTRAAMGIPDFPMLLDAWERTAPLQWDPDDKGPAADAVCFLLSDYARATTGSVLYADGGAHATQA